MTRRLARFSLPVIALAIFTIASSPITADDWPQFRGPDGTATAPDSGVPLRWSDSENMAWKTELPGHGASSPVVWRGKVYLTAYTGYGLTVEEAGDPTDLRFHVICLDLATGDIVWDQSRPTTGKVQKITPRIVDHGYASSTPACDDSGVYAYFGTSGMVAYDLEGKLKWTADVGDGTAGFGSAASPIIYKDLVIMNASIESKCLFAFDKNNGEVVWKAEGIDRSWSVPTVAEVPGGEPELLMSFKEHIVGIDPTTGDELWRCRGIQDYVVPCPIAHEGVGYFIGGRTNQAIAIKLGGRGDVTDSHTLWSVDFGANVTSPVYHDGFLYWASDRGMACCLEAATGETVYRERMPTRARVYASVVLIGDRLYCTTRDSGVVVLQATPKFTELAVNEISAEEAMFNASPAVADGKFLLRTHNYLYAIGQK